MFYLIALLILIIISITTMAIAAFSAAPYVPLFKKDIRRMLKLANVSSNDVVYDLGSGDGRILVIAAKEFGAGKCTGFEISFLPYIYSKLKIILLGLNKSIDIIPKNFYNQDISSATVITCFLTPHAMKKLSPKFNRELKPGTRVVSYAFALPNVKPEVKHKPTPKTTAIYLYKF